MTNENKIFLPVFYSYLDLTESLSNEEFGLLLRELLRSHGEKGYSAELPASLRLAYNFMLDNAIRIFNSNARCSSDKAAKTAVRKSNTSKHESSFDAEDAFQKALARTYGKMDNE